ncbi:MAG: hypothetical protein AAF617_10430 [Bacteroidota bacterium]
MKLALQHTHNNPYPRCGIFVKHASPEVWLQQITRMQLKLSECTVYPCPALEANSIAGVLIIFKTNQKKIEIQSNRCIQKVTAGFYIPENTQLNMALTQEEYAKLLQGKPHFFHHEYGLIELKEEVQWETLLQTPVAQFPTIETPSKGVQIPMKVTAFSVEIEETETEKAISNPLGDEKVDTDELPFEMKKVLEGNNKEVEKYLKYLEKNPEAALKMAVPLDMLGTSRGKAFAKYRFKTNFFSSIGLGNTSENTKTGIKTVLGILAIIAIFWLGSVVIDSYKKNQIQLFDTENINTDTTSEELPEGEEVVFETDDMTNNSISRRRSSIDPRENTEPTLTPVEFLLICGIVIIAFIFIRYLLANRKKKRYYRKQFGEHKTKSSWMNLPEESELFSFVDEPKKSRGYAFYFGGDELSVPSQIILIFILIAAIGYLLYPMFTKPGIKGIFVILTIGFVLRMLYFLLNKNKSLKDDQP